MFGPDETASNRLGAIFGETGRAWMAERRDGDDHLTPDGRVMEVLSEHLCQGWLEGYLLTGRHGIFNCYEAFIHIVDSMFNQHAKWLKVTREIPWRRPIASLNYLLSSHVWRQDHNGFSHQDPGFIDHVVNKKAEIVRVYLPPDANCLLSVADHCLRSRDYVNVIVAGKQPSLDYLSIDDAITHCTRGIGIWDWASTDAGAEPDVVLACAGDIPTLETLAAAALLREHLPELRVRVVNVVDLMRLQPPSEHPHGLPDAEFDALFTDSQPVIFAYHGYPWLIHRLTYRRTQPRQPARARLQGGGHDHHAVRHGDAQRPRPLPPRHGRDRPRARAGRARGGLRQQMADERLRHRAYTREHGDDPPDVRDWTWPGGPSAREEPRARRPGLSGRQVRVLVVNAGSSSLKLSLLDADDSELWSRELAAPRAVVEADVVAAALAELPAKPDVAGHRIVHGGERFREAVVVDEHVEAALRELAALAPLHQPKSLAALDAVGRALPKVPAVACFDTAFHATLLAGGGHLRAAARMARAPRPSPLRLPRPVARLRRACRRRRRAGSSPATWARAHRCAPCSTAARWTRRWASPRSRGSSWRPARARSIPACCCGSSSARASASDAMAEALEHESGLLGLAGTADMRELLARDDPDARLALDVYIHRLRAGIAAMAASLGGLDALVFTGGVGERAARVRELACAGLGHLGVGGPGSTVRVLTVQAREDLEIARQARALLGVQGLEHL